jgi:hypothetical protein
MADGVYGVSPVAHPLGTFALAAGHRALPLERPAGFRDGHQGVGHPLIPVFVTVTTIWAGAAHASICSFMR